MISIRLKQFLDEKQVRYDVIRHDPAFTAQHVAAEMHVPGRELVKAVVVKLNGRYALVAVPAPRLVDLKALAKVAGVAKCSLASESEFQQLFPDCEAGAMPPFGHLYDLPTFVDEEVALNESVVINAGTHAEAIRLRYVDLERLASPRLGHFVVPPPVERAAAVPAAKTPRRPAKKKAAKRKKKVAKKKTPKKAAKRKPKKKVRKSVRAKKKSRARKTTRKPVRKKTKARRKKKK